MAAFAVAPPAGGEFVLDPARTALDARHEMLCGRRNQPDLEWAAAPYARRAVAREHDL